MKCRFWLPRLVLPALMLLFVSTSSVLATEEELTPRFAICGSMWQNVPPGTWTVATETATVYFKSKNSGSMQFYGVNFGRSAAKAKTKDVRQFPVVELKDFSSLPEFSDLQIKFVSRLTWLTYPEVKGLAQKHLSAEAYRNFVKSMDTYFKEYPNLY